MKTPLATLTYPFPFEFVRDHYSRLYLLKQITEDYVQASILDALRAFQIDAIAIDAGGKKERSTMIRRARARGLDLGDLTRGGSGSSIPPGHSDLVATLAPDGMALYVEVKAPAWIDEFGRQVRPAGKPTLEQLDFLLSKYQRGAIALVAYSIEDVTALLGDRLERNYRALRRETL